MDSSTEKQLYAILNRKWQPDDDDRYVLQLNGPESGGVCRFVWIHRGSGLPCDRPVPGVWSVEGTKLVLRSERTEDREYAVEYNAETAELTLTDQGGNSRRFAKAGEARIEHPASKAARCVRDPYDDPRQSAGA